jgi:hypothetical protein
VPGQFSDPTRAQQVTTPFGAYTVYPDAGTTMTPAARNAIGQREFADLQAAWNRIERSLGPFINGEGANAAENRALADRFRQILAEEMPDSPYLRRLIIRITQDQDHPFAINVVRGRANVWVDSFSNRGVDLQDLEHFDRRNAPHRHPNEVSRGEILVHFLGERYHDLTHPLPPGDQYRFGPAHDQAIVEQNRYRAERGQVPVETSVLTRGAPGTGELTWRVRFRDGTTQVVDTDASGTIISNAMLDRNDAPISVVRGSRATAATPAPATGRSRRRP